MQLLLLSAFLAGWRAAGRHVVSLICCSDVCCEGASPYWNGTNACARVLHFLKLCRGCRGKLQLGIFVTACSVRGFGFEDCKSLSDEQGFRENLFCHSLAASGDRAEQQAAGQKMHRWRNELKEKENAGNSYWIQIYEDFFSLFPLKDSLSEIFTEANSVDWVAESFLYSSFQKAKVFLLAPATALSKGELQPPPA